MGESAQILNEELERKDERIIGIDILKIVAMLMMVTLHILAMTGFMLRPQKTITSIATNAIYYMTMCAVNCYAISTGFLCVGRKYKFSRIIYIWVQTLFYSVIIAFIMKLVSPEITFRSLLSYFTPIISKKYWYISAYVGLFLFMPLLNCGIEGLTKRQFKIVLIGLLVVVSGTALIYAVKFETDPFALKNGFSTLWLSIMYLVGAYIKKYKVEERASIKIVLPVFIGINSIIVGVQYFLTTKGLSLDAFSFYNFPTAVISALSLFLLCAKVKTIKSKWLSKTISIFSTATLGVYLIHIHPLLYGEFDRFVIESSGIKFFLVNFSIILILYIGCTLIDIGRQYLFKWIKIPVLCEKIDKKIDFNKEEKVE